ncbi:MAG: NRDE family protein [Bacteroidota bacterium]|nr:NRDE family protein [Candidatus Kapabacteria bacterium]MDW8220697.1 NRDE family protein [Bacteroidota bacterium]
MCLIVVALHAHSHYPVVLAANRDEFIQRPTHQAHWWVYFPDVLGGMDLEAGGTWLGITRSGRFVAVTNVRDAHNINPDAPSRGELSYKFLTQNWTNEDFRLMLERRGRLYNGFNIIWGNLARHELFWYSNYATQHEVIESGIHGISNALLNTPWHKVERAKTLVATVLNDTTISQQELCSHLFAILRDTTPADDALLPDTGVGIAWERQLSPIFIHSPEHAYGTRCSTILLVDAERTVTFIERRFTPSLLYGRKEEYPGETSYTFTLEKT